MEHDRLVAALRAAVEAHGGEVLAVDAEDGVHVEIGGRAARIYLDNLRRRIAAGEPEGEVAARFVQALASPPDPTGDAPDRRAGLRLALERREVLVSTGALQRDISKEIALALAWTDPKESTVRFMTPDVLAAWSLEPDEAWAEAGRQMDALLAETPIEVDQVAGSRLAMLATDSIFKASLIAAPSLRRHVEPLLGWPAMAVAPCRDFVYVLPGDAHDLVARLGSVVLREYSESPYPLSPEVFSISDTGIAALGSFVAP